MLGITVGIKALGLGGSATVVAGSTIETAIYRLLAEDETITGLVSTRIYPNVVPQEAAMPAITYQEISGPRDMSCDGPTGKVFSRFQINCWDDNYSTSRELAEAVRKCLNNYSGTVNSVVIDVIMLDNEGDMPSIMAGADVLRRFGKFLDFMVMFEDAN